MSTYTLEVDDSILAEKISDILNQALNRELSRKYSNLHDAIAASVKDLVYSRKDEIIELVVERAAREIKKKALPRLLERMEGETE